MAKLPKHLYLSVLKKNVKKYGRPIPSEAIAQAAQKTRLLMFRPDILDREYTILPTWLMKDLIERDQTDKARYIRESKDCDDFSFQLFANIRWTYKVNTIGIALDWTESHAYCWTLTYTDTNDYVIHRVEPQTDQMVKMKPDTSGRPCEQGRVII